MSLASLQMKGVERWPQYEILYIGKENVHDVLIVFDLRPVGRELANCEAGCGGRGEARRGLVGGDNGALYAWISVSVVSGSQKLRLCLCKKPLTLRASVL